MKIWNVNNTVGHGKETTVMTVIKPQTTLPGAGSIWPQGVRLYVYDHELSLIDESSDRRYDLHDNLFQVWPEDHRRVYLGVEINNVNWHVWDEKSLRWIEEMIVADFRFDGGIAKLQRHTRKSRRPCSEEFIWLVDVRDDDGESE